MDGKSEPELESLFENQTLANPCKLIAMKLYLSTAVGAWYEDGNLLAACSLGVFRLALQHRCNQYTGIACMSFGALLGDKGDMEQGYRLTQVGLKAQKEEDVPPDAILIAYSSILHEKLPLASLLEMSLAGYRRGLSIGETFSGSVCLAVYVDAYKGSGLLLDLLASDLRKYAEQLKILHCDFVLCMILPTFQLALNLTGQSGEQLSINWDVIDKHGYFHRGVELSIPYISLRLH